MAHASEITTATICDAIGRSKIAHRLGVRVTAISNAVTDGKFPARWYLIISRLCEEAGIPCPDCLFSFAGTDAADQNATNQSETSHEQSKDSDAA